MLESISSPDLAQFLFDRENVAEKGGGIIGTILEARSLRLSDISQRMEGKPAANYKEIQRFLAQADPQAALKRLFQEESPFVIGDVTEIERPQARKTAYVGTLKDGQTKGIWLLMVAMLFLGPEGLAEPGQDHEQDPGQHGEDGRSDPHRLRHWSIGR